MHNEVKKHLMDDIGMFKKEAAEDKKLIKKISAKKEYGKKSKDCECEENMKAVKVKKVAKVANPKAGKKLGMKGKVKLDKVIKEFAAGKLRSGSKKGPKVKNVKQALAIGYSEARKAAKRK
jgi:hypothetical protein